MQVFMASCYFISFGANRQNSRAVVREPSVSRILECRNSRRAIYRIRQPIVSYLRNTPIQRRRSHSGKTRRRYNRELRIRYNNFSSKKNIYVLKDINFINSYTEKSHFAKNMCKCIFDQIHEFTTTLAAFKSKTGHVAQPITDAADTTALDLQHAHTSSYNNYYYYVTLTVKLIVVIYR